MTTDRNEPSTRQTARDGAPRRRTSRPRTRAAVVVAVTGLIAVGGCGSDGTAGDAADGAVEDTGAVTSTAVVVEETSGAPVTSAGGASDDTVTDGDPPDPTTSAAGSDGGSDPCGVLAGVDIAALIGEAVTEPNGSEDLMGDSCRVDPVSGSSAGLRVVVTTQEAADNFENQREVLGVDTEASGIGDRAFHTGPYLIVLDGEHLVLLQVVRDSEVGFNVPDAELEAAAQTILGNLSE